VRPLAVSSSFARIAVLVVSCGGPAYASAQDDGEADEDRIIIVEDEPLPTEPTQPSEAGADEGPDEIIIIDDPDEGEADSPTAVPISGALGRLWETWHVAADSDLLGTVQLVEPEDGPYRLLGSVWIETWLLPAQNLSLYGNGFARAAIDGTPTGRLVPYSDVYEAYAKVNVDRAVVTLGRIVVPWGRTQGAALGDRLNPPDHRRGPPFPDPARQKQPMWGGTLRTSLGSLGIETVAFAQYDPSEGALAASSQGGVRIARYQSALVRSPARASGLLSEDDRAPLLEPSPLVATATLAARAWRRVGDFDVSGSVVWGFDETPTLRLRPDVSRALAGELLALRPLPPDDAPLACGDDVSLACVGNSGAIAHGRTTSFSLDASWGLGIVIVRAEATAYPDVGALGGKTAILVDDLGLRSDRVSQYAAALAVEGSIGDGIDGSLELFDVVWTGVPAEALLWGVDSFATALPDDVDERTVHRLAGAVSLGGAFFEDRVRWRVRGEAGILQPDVLMSAELRYRLPILGLYVGGRTDLFTGVAGSPGWFRQDGSLVGVFVGEGN
jgi:hypothetical protein